MNVFKNLLNYFILVGFIWQNKDKLQLFMQIDNERYIY